MFRTLAAILLTATTATAQNSIPFASFVAASEPTLNDPHDLAFGPDGNLYIADKFANRVAIMDPDTLEVIGSIGDGALFGAHDVSFGPDGLLYVAATSLGAVVSYDVSGESPKSVRSLGPFPRTEGALAHSNGDLYVMASGIGQLNRIKGDEIVASASGMLGAHDVAEGPDGTRVLSGPKYGFIGPRYLDIDEDGILFVADQDAHRILKIDPLASEVLGVIGSGSPGLGPNLFDDPEGVAIRGSEYFFSDSDNNRIVKYIVALN